MKKLCLSLLAACMIWPVMAQQMTLQEVELKWTGSAALGTYSLSGTLPVATGMLTLAEGQVTAAAVQVDMTALDAENENLEKHLRGKDFFHVKKFKEASFVLTSAVDLSVGSVQGDLTIKGHTEPITLKPLWEEENGGWRLRGKLVVDRTRFGMTYNSPSFFDNLKDQAIADEFEVWFSLFFGH